MENLLQNSGNFTLRSSLKQYVLFLLITCLSLSAFAGSKTWSGSANSDWNNPANWTINVLPSSGETAIIPGGLPNYPVINNYGNNFSTYPKQFRYRGFGYA